MSHLSQLLYAYGKPSSTAVIRRHPEDFKVSEKLSFSLDGKGQHVYLFIQKRNLNTDQVAKSLAKFADVKQVAIGYAGMKDKHAVTKQWFSVDLAGQPEPDWHELEDEEIKMLEVLRHSRKLKRGAIAENQFEILITGLEGNKDELEQRLEKVKLSGVPNYFGGQRFGRNDANLRQAEKLVADDSRRLKRNQRGIYLSAARSFLFNQVLSHRVEDNSWNSALAGDVFMLDGSHSIFTPEQNDEVIKQRVAENDIHPTGPMWGSGELISQHAVLQLEKHVVSNYQQWCTLLEKAGMKQERRSIRLPVRELKWEWLNGGLNLWFNLPAGSYATSVLRELIIH